jgi:hypothetical protein
MVPWAMLTIHLTGCMTKLLFIQSTAGMSLSQWDNEYEPSENPISSSQKANGKKEFRRWLASTGYQGRWRSTENYRALSRHDQATFRTQVKAIFHHVLNQLASTDADIVWEGVIDDETRKPTTTKNG